MTSPGIVFLGHTGKIGGGEIALLRLLPELLDLNPLVLLAQDGPMVGAVRATGAAVKVIPLGETADLRKDAVTGRRLPLRPALRTGSYAVRLAREIRRLHPQIVHTNTMKAHLYGGVAARLARTPQVWHARDRVATDYLPGAAVKLVRAAARILPAAVIANSRATLETLPGVKRGVVVFDSAPVLSQREREPDGPFTVGHVGRLSPWKGQDIFLRAFAAAFPDGDERAVIVGSALFGELEFAMQLRAIVTELGISDRVEFVGQVDDVPAQLRRFHVLVHSSTLPEPFGQVIIEGMTAGLPVIAAGAGGPAEIVDDGVTAMLTTPGDVAALAAAMRTLRSEPELRATLGARGQLASASYRADVVAAAVREVYASVLGRR